MRGLQARLEGRAIASRRRCIAPTCAGRCRAGLAAAADRRARHRLPPARQIHPDAAGRRRFACCCISACPAAWCIGAGCGRTQPTLHEHLVLETDDGWRVGFVDPRRFGSVDLVPTAQEDAHRLLAGAGAGAAGCGVHRRRSLSAALAGKKTPIKAALLDQKVVAGLGNIYVCEALFRAGISPRARRTRCRARAPRGWCRRSRRRCARRSPPAGRRCATTCSRTASWAISSTPGRSMAARASPASAARAAGLPGRPAHRAVRPQHVLLPADAAVGVHFGVSLRGA